MQPRTLFAAGLVAADVVLIAAVGSQNIARGLLPAGLLYAGLVLLVER